MNVDNETLTTGLKFMGAFIGLLFLVYLLAELTPLLAKKIDSLSKSKKKDPSEERIYEVKGIYDAQSDDKNNLNGDDESGKGQ